MATNKIVKFSMEKRVKELLSMSPPKTERQIASILTTESNQKITQSCVHRFITAREDIVKQAIQKSVKLTERAAGLELDTVQQRQDIIKEIQELAKKAKEDGDLKTALYGLDKAIGAMDSLDKRLGRFTKEGAINVNVHINQQINDIVAIVLKHCNPEQVAAIRQELLACQPSSS